MSSWINEAADVTVGGQTAPTSVRVSQAALDVALQLVDPYSVSTSYMSVIPGIRHENIESIF